MSEPCQIHVFVPNTCFSFYTVLAIWTIPQDTAEIPIGNQTFSWSREPPSTLAYISPAIFLSPPHNRMVVIWTGNKEAFGLSRLLWVTVGLWEKPFIPHRRLMNRKCVIILETFQHMLESYLGIRQRLSQRIEYLFMCLQPRMPPLPAGCSKISICNLIPGLKKWSQNFLRVRLPALLVESTDCRETKRSELWFNHHSSAGTGRGPILQQ